MTALDEHAEVTARLVAVQRDLAKIEAVAEEEWFNGYVHSQATSASGRENDARAAASLSRREMIRLRGEVQAELAQERLVALRVQYEERR